MRAWMKKQGQTIVTGIIVTIVLAFWGIFLVFSAFPASPTISQSPLALSALSGREIGQYGQQQNVLSPQVAPTPTSTPQQNSSDATFPAWLGFVGVILAALIALIGVIWVAVYNNRRTAQFERERNEAQRKLEQERNAAQLELERKRLELDQERMRFQTQMEAEKATSERERQRKEIDDEAAKEAMQKAKTIAEREQAYRDLLQADPR